MSFTFVQKLPSQVLGGTSPVQSGAFSANPTVGNYLFCTISSFMSSTGTHSVSDSAGGNTWISAGTFEQSSDASDFERVSVFYCLVANTGASFKITVASTGATPEPLFQCSEFSIGAGNTIAVDTPAGATGGNLRLTTSLTIAGSSTATAGELLFGVFGAEGSLTTAGISNPCNFNGSAAGVTSIAFSNDDTTIEGGQHSYVIASGSGTATSFNWTYSSDAALPYPQYVGLSVAFKETAGAAADQPPSQISYTEDISLVDDPAIYDQSPYDFYTDTTANRADVVPPIPVELPQSYEWEDVNNADEALWQWPLSQAPPIADVAALDMPFTEDSDAQPGEDEEPFGFFDSPLPDDVLSMLVIDFDAQNEEEEDSVGFFDAPFEAPVVSGFIQPDDIDQPDDDADEPFGFGSGPLQDDDQGSVELANDQPDDEQIEGFSIDPTPEDSPMLAIVEDSEQPEEDEFAEGFADQPLGADVIGPVDQIYPEDASNQPLDVDDEDFALQDQPLSTDAVVDQVFVEDATDQPTDPEDEDFAFSDQPSAEVADQIVVEDGTFQPPDPEDEDFATFDQPLASDVFDLNIVWPECSDNQIDTPDDEEFSFSIGPTPDDVIPPPAPVTSGQDGAHWPPMHKWRYYADDEPEPVKPKKKAEPITAPEPKPAPFVVKPAVVRIAKAIEKIARVQEPLFAKATTPAPDLKRIADLEAALAAEIARAQEILVEDDEEAIAIALRFLS